MMKNQMRWYLFFCLFVLALFLISGSSAAEVGQTVRVRKGDTISYLAFKIYGRYDPRMIDLLGRENPQIKDMDLIYAGQQIRFPAPEDMRKWLSEKTARPAEPAQEAKEPGAKEESLPTTQVRANKAVITFLEGQVQVKRAGEDQWSLARPNLILSEKDQIRILAKSRAELILDNQSVMRLSENTLLTIHKLEEDAASLKETTRLELSLGKLWTRTAKLFNPASRYDIRTPTTIAGVQGTVYQVSVRDDRSTRIHVFQGVVNVYSPFPTPGRSQLEQPTRVDKPQEVPGPEEVSGPTTVSREEWTQIVLRQYQQINVTDQDISRPTAFDVQEERQDEWVRWNEERDLDFQPPARLR